MAGFIELFLTKVVACWCSVGNEGIFIRGSPPRKPPVGGFIGECLDGLGGIAKWRDLWLKPTYNGCKPPETLQDHLNFAICASGFLKTSPPVGWFTGE